jgi:TatD DNase family protein
MPTIIDTHTHFYDIQDPVATLRSSAESGVSDVVALGVDYSSNIKHLDMVMAGSTPSPKIHLALGIHPGMVAPEDVEKCFTLFREVLSPLSPSPLWGGSGRGERCRIVAIGEIGLDFSYKPVREDKRKRDLQRDVFRRQIELAREFDLPVVVHSRQSGRECLDIARAAGIKKANFHWYSGPLDLLKEVLDAGYVISVSPALEYSPQVKEAAIHAPLERILVETDTPTRGWMPPDVWRTLNALCELKKMDKEQALEIVNANARAFFNI